MNKETIILAWFWLKEIGIAFVVGGLVGAVVQRMRKRMTIRQFLSVAVMGMFIENKSLDDSMNIVLSKIDFEEIFKAMYDKSMFFEFDLT